jgi:hypothetical protein
MPMTTGDKSRRRFFAMKFAATGLLTFLFFASYATALSAQTIQIKVVDGKTGRPVAGVCVGVWITDASNKTLPLTPYIPADKNGVARLRLAQKDNEVNISYDPKLGCGGSGAINPVLKYDDTLTSYTTLDHPSCAFPQSIPNARFNEIDFSTNEVIQHGVVSANTCGKVTASPQPGEVILFVRPRNFREKVQDWLNSEAFPL